MQHNAMLIQMHATDECKACDHTATEFLTLLAFGTNVSDIAMNKNVTAEQLLEAPPFTFTYNNLQQQCNHKCCEASVRLNLYWHILDISALSYHTLTYSHFYLPCIYLACIYHTLIYSHFYLLYLACKFCTTTLTVLYLPPPMYLACMHTVSLNVRLLFPN